MQRQAYVSHSKADFLKNVNTVAVWHFENISVFVGAFRTARHSNTGSTNGKSWGETNRLADQWQTKGLLYRNATLHIEVKTKCFKAIFPYSMD